MTEWRLPAAIDAIVAALQTAGIQVWDGPLVTGDYSDAVYIGYDADPRGGEELASVTQQDWAGIGQRRRNDEHTITCAIVVLIGTDATSWKPARDKVAALLDTVGQVLRNDATLGPSLGLSPPSVAQLQPGSYFQESLEEGFQARLLFTINYRTRV
jgi:hypothetical protein